MALSQTGDKVSISAILTREIKDNAEAHAKALGLNLSAYIRMALINQIKRDDDTTHFE